MWEMRFGTKQGRKASLSYPPFGSAFHLDLLKDGNGKNQLDHHNMLNLLHICFSYLYRFHRHNVRRTSSSFYISNVDNMLPLRYDIHLDLCFRLLFHRFGWRLYIEVEIHLLG